MRKMTLGLTALTALGLSACKTDDRIKELEASNALMRETLTMMTQGQYGMAEEMVKSDTALQNKMREALKKAPEQAKMMKEQQAKQAQQDSAAATTVYDIPVDGSPVAGASNAKITIVEFSDMECPYCVRHTPEIQKIIATYGSDVRVVYKHFPLPMHKNAKSAHAAARAAEVQGKFWEFRYALAALGAEGLNPAAYEKIATDLKLDVAKFKADMAVSADDEKRFEQDIAAGQKIGVNGTPSYFINGKRGEATVAAIGALLKK